LPAHARTTADSSVWGPGPRRPRLQAGAVDVWRADLDAVSEDLTRVLSGDEQARAAHILSERDRLLWSRSHGLLRTLLGGYLDCDPASLRFDAGPQGKPSLGSAHTAATGIGFNLSHSGTLALVGVTDAGQIGVDVEVARRPLNELAVAGRMLGPEAAAHLEHLDPARREQEFLRLWARNEARAKCLGAGLAKATPRPAGRDEPWVTDLDIGPDAAAALALEREPQRILCFSYV